MSTEGTGSKVKGIKIGTADSQLDSLLGQEEFQKFQRAADMLLSDTAELGANTLEEDQITPSERAIDRILAAARNGSGTLGKG